MILKLRKKFILIAMLSTLIVLSIIIGTLNIVNYMNMVNDVDAILDVLAENNASFPDISKESDIEISKSINEETPFDTRYFSVSVSSDLVVNTIDTGKISSVDSSTAAKYALTVINKNRTRGYYKNYRYLVVEEDDDYTVIFVNQGQELSSFRLLAFSSISISIIGFLTVSILIIIFSKRVFMPVEESYRKQKQFITDASHELKTPITIISANMDVLEIENDENNWTKSIRHQLKRLSSLIEQMVTLTRIDEMNELTTISEFSLSQLMLDTIDPFHEVAYSKNKELLVDIDDDCQYQGDKNMIKQMISLIMDNACKYSSEMIHVSLKKTGKNFILEFYNTVESIPKGNLDQLFERFYRLDSSRNSNTGGSGIGLSIVKSIVEAHKGQVHASSEDGKSLKIVIKL